jgi:hypothetical protein
MRIRMLVDMPGTRNGQPWPPKGEVTEDIPTAEAAHLVGAGVAEQVDDEPKQRPARRKPSGEGG